MSLCYPNGHRLDDEMLTALEQFGTDGVLPAAEPLPSSVVIEFERLRTTRSL